MLQIRTSVVAGVNGSTKAVVGSGTTSVSLSWICWKRRIDEPSNPMPSLRASTFTALGGTEKCCHTPGKSVNRRSTIWTFSSLIVFTRSSAVAQFGTMAYLLSPRGGASKIVLPFSGCQAPTPPPRRFSIWHGGARIQTRLVTREPAASALVRPAHEFHGVFDMPPVLGKFGLALCLKVDGVLSSFRNGLHAVCFQ